MTLDTDPAAPSGRAISRRPRVGILLSVSAGCVAVLAVAAVGLAADPRLITGSPAWLKVMKFAVSISVYCVTLAWLLTLVQGRPRLVRTVAWATGLALGLELVLIAMQVIRGQASHYNISTPFDAGVFQLMGSTLPPIYGAAVVTAALLARQRGLRPVLASGIRGGLVICLLGMAQGSLMIANGANAGPGMIGAHTVGGLDGGPGMPLTGWSTEHGDLRIAHFVGLHALQALPLLAWLVQRYATGLGVLAQVRLVRLGTVACGAVLALLTWQAQRGLPLLRPDATVLIAAGLVAAGLVAAAAAVLAQSRRTP